MSFDVGMVYNMSSKDACCNCWCDACFLILNGQQWSDFQAVNGLCTKACPFQQACRYEAKLNSYNFLIESMQIITSSVHHEWVSRSIRFTMRGSRSQGKADMVKLSHGKDSSDLISMVSSVGTRVRQPAKIPRGQVPCPQTAEAGCGRPTKNRLLAFFEGGFAPFEKDCRSGQPTQICTVPPA